MRITTADRYAATGRLLIVRSDPAGGGHPWPSRIETDALAATGWVLNLRP
ncbi:MAG: hypothetical protein KAY32_02695 [Candidatus Eisenbacteria sp.]|nr:hypothetical protein [Candidatus Eisenbacteria bacterium]